MKTLLLIGAASVLATTLGGCVVAPARPVYVTPAVAPVYVEPAYASPGIGWAWEYHPRYGWGWHHPEHGWHRGWH